MSASFLCRAPFRRRAALVAVVALAALSVPVQGATAGATVPPAEALLPDIQTVVPLHIQLVNAHQREVLRFSNGIANTGAGPLQLLPEFPASTAGSQLAVQELLDVDGNVVFSEVVSEFEFHPDHNHWHIAAVAEFSVRSGAPDGPLVSGSQKVTFCLIDWYKLSGNSRTPDRTYSECNAAHQGISPGWVDQYHHATEGQALDITGAPPGRYYLVSTSNPEGAFFESDPTNNTAWTAFELSRQSNGNPKIRVVGTSACSSPGLCGEKAPNR